MNAGVGVLAFRERSRAITPESPPSLTEAPELSQDVALLTLGDNPLFDRPAVLLLLGCRSPVRWLVHVELVRLRTME